MLDWSNINQLWGSLIVEELLRGGVGLFCLSPGSRSTPLTVAVARSRARAVICYDERGAAFQALGYARATRRAAVLICTSGTALANYMPALIEACVDQVPLLILSSDRPPELRQTMANQTIVQPNLFGGYVHWQFDLPVPTDAIAPHMVLTTIAQALYRTQEGGGGPVHVNCMFREPLAPVDRPLDARLKGQLSAYAGSDRPYTTYAHPTLQAPDEMVALAQTLIERSERGLIVAGQLKSAEDRAAALRLAERLGWPLLPDITSGLRLGKRSPLVLAYYDQTLLSTPVPTNPQTVLHIGGQFVSKRLLQYLAAQNPTDTIIINDNPQRYDPNHQVSLRIQSTVCAFVDKLIPNIHSDIHSSWTKLWQRRNSVARDVLLRWQYGRERQPVGEIDVALRVTQLIAKESALFIGNSMPIRDFDMYAVDDGAAVAVAANRGASGIDGNLATAIGFARGRGQPLTVVVGDLTLLHDMNSLTLLAECRQPITLIVINNGGGGIFSFLPIARFGELFERYFGTPHQLSFKPLAEMFGLNYAQPATVEAFSQAYRTAAGRQHTLIEVLTEREHNLAQHQRLQQQIRRRLEADA